MEMPSMPYQPTNTMETLHPRSLMTRKSPLESKVCPVSSFTAINLNQLPVQAPPSRSTLLATIKRTSVYELQEDSDPEDHMLNNHEQVCTSTNHTANFVDMSINGADLAQYIEVELQEPAPKRKKCVAQMQSQSLKSSTEGSKMDLVPASKNCEDAAQECHRQSASERTTSMDSLKRRKGRESLLIPSSKMKHNSPFQNASVIKFSAPKGKESFRVLPQTFAQQKQFTTTEQQLSLSKSTIERLAVFRYKSQFTGQVSTIESSSIDSEPTETCSSRRDLEPNDKPYFSSCNRTRSSGNDLIHEPVETVALECELDSTDAQSVWHEQGINHEAGHQDSQSKDLSKKVDTEIRNTRANIYYYDIELQNSSSNQVIGSDPDVEGLNPTMEKETNIFPSLAADIEESTNFLEHKELKVYLGAPPKRDDTIDSLGVPNACLPAITYRSSIQKRRCESVQIGQSDSSRYETVSDFVSKDLYANHTFDEGLNDDDFLEISLASSMPMILPERFDGTCDKFQKLHIPQAAMECHSKPQINDFILLTPSGSRDEDSTRDCLTSDTAVLEAVDEFCIDEEDEEELLRLADPSRCADIFMVTEDFEPPTSVQDAMCIGSNTSELYDSALQFSPLKYQAQADSPNLAYAYCANSRSNQSPKGITNLEPPPVTDEEDWSFVRSHNPEPFRDILGRARHLFNSTPLSLPNKGRSPTHVQEQINTSQNYLGSTHSVLDDSHEYKALRPFARPNFPILIPDRSPVVGLSSLSFLRVCFRIGEMYREGARCNALGTEAVIELFARVGFSSREAGTIKQHFQFLDLWHDRPPIAAGILASYNTTSLAESESKAFLDGRSGKMARCLGRLKRDARSHTGWLLHIMNIRETDWEEIRWTRRIVSGDHSKSHNEVFCS